MEALTEKLKKEIIEVLNLEDVKPEDIDVDAQTTEFTGQVADINVHSASILASQGGQWTGMVRKHGNV